MKKTLLLLCVFAVLSSVSAISISPDGAKGLAITNLPEAEGEVMLLNDLTISLPQALNLTTAQVGLKTVPIKIEKGEGLKTLKPNFALSTSEEIFVAYRQKDSASWIPCVDNDGVPVSVVTGGNNSGIKLHSRKVSGDTSVVRVNFFLDKSKLKRFDVGSLPTLTDLTVSTDLSDALTKSAVTDPLKNYILFEKPTTTTNVSYYTLYYIDTKVKTSVRIRTSERTDTLSSTVVQGDDLQFRNILNDVMHLVTREVGESPFSDQAATVDPKDKLFLWLKVSAMLDRGVFHTSPKINSEMEKEGVSTSYTQFINSIFRNWETVKSSSAGKNRLTGMFSAYLTDQKVQIEEPLVIENKGIVNRIEGESTETKNYLFYDMLSRLDLEKKSRFNSDNLLGVGIQFTTKNRDLRLYSLSDNAEQITYDTLLGRDIQIYRKNFNDDGSLKDSTIEADASYNSIIIKASDSIYSSNLSSGGTGFWIQAVDKHANKRLKQERYDSSTVSFEIKSNSVRQPLTNNGSLNTSRSTFSTSTPESEVVESNSNIENQSFSIVGNFVGYTGDEYVSFLSKNNGKYEKHDQNRFMYVDMARVLSISKDHLLDGDSLSIRVLNGEEHIEISRLPEGTVENSIAYFIKALSSSALNGIELEVAIFDKEKNLRVCFHKYLSVLNFNFLESDEDDVKESGDEEIQSSPQLLRSGSYEGDTYVITKDLKKNMFKHHQLFTYDQDFFSEALVLMNLVEISPHNMLSSQIKVSITGQAQIFDKDKSIDDKDYSFLYNVDFKTHDTTLYVYNEEDLKEVFDYLTELRFMFSDYGLVSDEATTIAIELSENKKASALKLEYNIKPTYVLDNKKPNITMDVAGNGRISPYDDVKENSGDVFTFWSDETRHIIDELDKRYEGKQLEMLDHSFIKVEKHEESNSIELPLMFLEFIPDNRFDGTKKYMEVGAYDKVINSLKGIKTLSEILDDYKIAHLDKRVAPIFINNTNYFINPFSLSGTDNESFSIAFPSGESKCLLSFCPKREVSGKLVLIGRKGNLYFACDTILVSFKDINSEFAVSSTVAGRKPNELPTVEAIDSYLWEDGKKFSDERYDKLINGKIQPITSYLVEPGALLEEYSPVEINSKIQFKKVKDFDVSKPYYLFVHGFNVANRWTDSEGIYSSNRYIYKTLSHLGYNGNVMFYNWNGRFQEDGGWNVSRLAPQAIFNFDQVMAFKSTLALEQFINVDLKKYEKDPIKKDKIKVTKIIAHSLGSQVVLDMLRLSMLRDENTAIDTVLFLEPAVWLETLQNRRKHDEWLNWRGLFEPVITLNTTYQLMFHHLDRALTNAMKAADFDRMKIENQLPAEWRRGGSNPREQWPWWRIPETLGAMIQRTGTTKTIGEGFWREDKDASEQEAFISGIFSGGYSNLFEVYEGNRWQRKDALNNILPEMSDWHMHSYLGKEPVYKIGALFESLER